MARVVIVLDVDLEALDSNGTGEEGAEISDIIEYNTGFDVEQVTIQDDDLEN